MDIPIQNIYFLLCYAWDMLAEKDIDVEAMVPDAYAGDFQQPEQRVGQIGFRFSF